ncbi:unnamed protein product [Prunus armeniaca]
MRECRFKQEDEKQNGATGFMHESKVGDGESKETLLLACHGDSMDDVWYLDSGASKHMTGNKNLFSSLSEIDHGQVTIGDARAYKIRGVGEVSFKSKSGKIEKMAEVYYVPGLKSNLLSMGHLLKKGFDINLHDGTCFLSKKNQIVAKIGVAANNLFPLRVQTTNLSCFVGIEKGISKLWHDTYGHMNYASLKLLSSKEMVDALPQIDHIDDVCEECQLGKRHRNSFPAHSSWRAKKPLELVHSYLCGQMSVTSHGGNKYFISFIDDFSRKVWVYFLKEKSEAFQAFKDFKAEIIPKKRLLNCIPEEEPKEQSIHMVPIFFYLQNEHRAVGDYSSGSSSGMQLRSLFFGMILDMVSKFRTFDLVERFDGQKEKRVVFAS